MKKTKCGHWCDNIYRPSNTGCHLPASRIEMQGIRRHGAMRACCLLPNRLHAPVWRAIRRSPPCFWRPFLPPHDCGRLQGTADEDAARYQAESADEAPDGQFVDTVGDVSAQQHAQDFEDGDKEGQLIIDVAEMQIRD